MVNQAATHLLKRALSWKLIRQIPRFTPNQSDGASTKSKDSHSATTLEGKPVLTLYTKDVCSLCEDAKEVLEPFMHRFNFEQVDIEAPSNKEWWEKYKFEIPVFHLNGKFLMKHKVNTKLLQRKLDELETK
ncbi:hypothetical protein CAPTEDRAFT_228559 [Capitella teleta]|uniref:Glutaredoxin-like protein n=1 Tax=Capitella teleta TaxID=283909 RepID=R7U4N6_CAPTE|nr:hypothetical protein CAPTEDRAFT_228559 [Capitella teleta]|eukprot:ELU01325.1 hypothetical protein CAPTEDRAFT_228559 [Capitella teleta]